MKYEPVPKYICPKCSHVFEANCGETTAIAIIFSEFEGYYCLKCLASWLSKNIPKLEEISPSDEAKLN